MKLVGTVHIAGSKAYKTAPVPKDKPSAKGDYWDKLSKLMIERTQGF
jgi:hypothetical protein